MPWRGHPDPYAVWISEIMLQQTRVDAVIPYFERFIAQFPSLEALAGADLQEVLRAWQGLGYYTRARNLHRAAQQLCRGQGATVPRTLEGLRALPGVGGYTAAAIASICFGIREPVVDGNVLRLAARMLRIRAPGRTAAALRRVEAWARELIGGCRVPGDVNQALMELGALVCTPRDPRCGTCPWARCCGAFAAGDPQQFPVKGVQRRLSTRSAVGVVLWKGRRLLLVRRAGERFLGELWELPGGFIAPGETAVESAMRLVPRQTGLTPGSLAPRGIVRQTYSHFRLELQVFEAHVASGRLQRGASGQARWTSVAGIGQLPLSNAPKAALALAAVCLDRRSQRVETGA